MKNTPKQINRRLHIMEEMINEPKNIAIGTIQNETHREKGISK